LAAGATDLVAVGDCLFCLLAAIEDLTWLRLAANACLQPITFLVNE